MSKSTRWFVVEYPTKESNEGRVLWQTETPSREEAAATLDLLRFLNPSKDYEISDLSDVVDVYVKTFQTGTDTVQ